MQRTIMALIYQHASSCAFRADPSLQPVFSTTSVDFPLQLTNTSHNIHVYIYIYTLQYTLICIYLKPVDTLTKALLLPSDKYIIITSYICVE